MCDDPNIINCLAQLGGFYKFAMVFGVIGLFIAPMLIKLAFSKKKDGTSRFVGHHLFLVYSFRVGAIVAAFSLVLAAFFIFPGVMFCSVFCFIGIGLPAVGVSTVLTLIPLLFLIFGTGSRATKP